MLEQERLGEIARLVGAPQIRPAQVLQGGRLLRYTETLACPGRHVGRVHHLPGQRPVALDAAQRILQGVVQDAAELHLRTRPRRQLEDKAVLVHLRTAQVGVHLRIGEGSDWRRVVERELDLTRQFDDAELRQEER